jgi:DNA-3-methyladenine glycosylase II
LANNLSLYPSTFARDSLVVEQLLVANDERLADVIFSQEARWPLKPTEHPIWGLMRIVMAQQVSTSAACRLAERARTLYPWLSRPTTDARLDVGKLRELGLPESRARCCITLLARSAEILSGIERGQSWQEALVGIKGIGPWTISVFRIMVLREPDVLPLGDLGLERAVRNIYGKRRNLERLSEKWRPYRSVACWYLWRTLGNEQLG